MKMLHRFLEKHDILYLKEMILTIMRELITNAVKANTKRLYFKLNNLDIKNQDEYRRGMEKFKEDVYSKEHDIFDKLQEVNLIVRVLFESLPGILRITVTNNIPLLKVELKKIESRLKEAYAYNDITEAFDKVLDDSEGAGLGLIMAMMLFKSAGLPADSFKIKSEKGLTSAILTVPLKTDRYRFNIKIADELIKEVEKIPSFPENILEIQRLTSNPESTIKQISTRIMMDPGLTTSILKLANSAGYITLQKTKTVEDAVKLIGLKAINTLLIASGVQKILDTRYKKFENIWKDSYRAASYAYKMAVQTRKTQLNEFIYLATLLSDIGLIILLSVKPETTKLIHDIAGTKIIENASLLEEMSLGVSHSTLGGLICQQWKFNETLIKVIEYHERPYIAPEKYKSLVYLVHLAYCFVNIEAKRQRFEFIDEDVLGFYNLREKSKFEILHNALKQSYELQQNGESAV
jgi:HD-like signal output (HDOD) protein